MARRIMAVLCHRGNFVEIIRRRIIIDRGAPRKGDGIQTSQEPSLERRGAGGGAVRKCPTPRAAMRFRNVGYTPPPLRVTGYLYAYPPGPSGDGWLDAARLCCHVPAAAALQPAWLQRPRERRSASRATHSAAQGQCAGQERASDTWRARPARTLPEANALDRRAPARLPPTQRRQQAPLQSRP